MCEGEDCVRRGECSPAGRYGRRIPHRMRRCVVGPQHGRTNQAGFTLIELLIVLLILAILATIVIFNVTGVRNKGQTASCNTDVKTVQSALDAYVLDKGSAKLSAGPITPGEWALLIPVYMHTQPSSCPNGFSLAPAGNNYTVSGS